MKTQTLINRLIKTAEKSGEIASLNRCVGIANRLTAKAREKNPEIRDFQRAQVQAARIAAALEIFRDCQISHMEFSIPVGMDMVNSAVPRFPENLEDPIQIDG